MSIYDEIDERVEDLDDEDDDFDPDDWIGRLYNAVDDADNAIGAEGGTDAQFRNRLIDIAAAAVAAAEALGRATSR